MAFEELVQPLVLKSDTFIIDEPLSEPLYLDIQNYNYYLKLLSVQFSNVVPNVVETLYVQNGSDPQQEIVKKGIWTIENLMDAYNALVPSCGTLSLYQNKLELKNTTEAILSLTSNFLTGKIGGFSQSQLNNLDPGDSVVADNAVVIQDFNYFILTSQIFSGNTLIKRPGQNSLSNTSALYAFTSAIPAYDTWEWTAMMPMLYQIKTENIQELKFEMKDGNDNSLSDIMGPTDFSVQGQIVRMRKI